MGNAWRSAAGARPPGAACAPPRALSAGAAGKGSGLGVARTVADSAVVAALLEHVAISAIPKTCPKWSGGGLHADRHARTPRPGS